jgi:predicted O-methyltransferase YrrM
MRTKLEFPVIAGFFSFPFLYKEMVSEVESPAHFVELGVWKGASAAFMAQEIWLSEKSIRFDAIDWFEGAGGTVFSEGENADWLYKHCLENLKPAIDVGCVNVLKLTTREAVKLYEDESLDFCFHDAAHEFDPVYEDVNNWWSKIKPGGVMAGHDYATGCFPAVQQAVDQFAAEKNLSVTNRQGGEGCWYIKKDTV